VFVVIVIQHTKRMRPIIRIVICGLSGGTAFVHIILQTARFSGKSYWN